MSRHFKVTRALGDRISLFLLGVSIWIRSRAWWRALYRYVPGGVRNKVSTLLTARAAERTRFAALPKVAAGPGGAIASSGPGNLGVAGNAGVNVFAYFRGQFGLGESARLYARALLDNGYPVALNDIGLDIPHRRDDTSMDGHLCTTAPYGIDLVFVNPDYFSEAMEAIGAARNQRRYIIACWFWELEAIPEEWRLALGQVDEIMVASAFIESAFRRYTDKPVFRVPLPVNARGDSGLLRSDFGLAPDKFVFMNTFDYNSSIARKNPFAVIDAFKKAFPQGRDDVQLLLKSSNGNRYPEKFHRLLSAIGGESRIMVRDEVIDRNHVHALQRCIDAYVSLHRAEGFGLGLAECMAMGKPVIATGWSGNLDFMTTANSCLVDYTLVPVEQGDYPHAEGARWAEPNVDQAAAFMRRLVDEPEYASRVGATAATDVSRMLCPQRAAQLLIQRLNQLSMRLMSAGPENASP